MKRETLGLEPPATVRAVVVLHPATRSPAWSISAFFARPWMPAQAPAQIQLQPQPNLNVGSAANLLLPQLQFLQLHPSFGLAHELSTSSAQPQYDFSRKFTSFLRAATMHHPLRLSTPAAEPLAPCLICLAVALV